MAAAAEAAALHPYLQELAAAIQALRGEVQNQREAFNAWTHSVVDTQQHVSTLHASLQTTETVYALRRTNAAAPSGRGVWLQRWVAGYG